MGDPCALETAPGIIFSPTSYTADGDLGRDRGFDRLGRGLIAGGIMCVYLEFEPDDAHCCICGGGAIFGGAIFGGAIGRPLALFGSNGTLTTGAVYGLACGTCVSGSSSP